MNRKLIKGLFLITICGMLMSACKSGDVTITSNSQTEYVTMENQWETEDRTTTEEQPTAEDRAETETQPVIPDNNTEYPTDTNVEDGIVLDLSLADAIRNELGYDKETILTYYDLESITNLWAFEEPINSLYGISQLVNLSDLRISSGNIEDISELSNMVSLDTINISNCYISEIPDLSNCTNLESLYLPGNVIKDISPLCNLESLKYVDITYNKIRSIAPIAGVTNIEALMIDNNCIIDYETIKDNNELITAINEGSQCTYEQCMEVEKRAKEIVATFPTDAPELEIERMIYQYVIDNMVYEVNGGQMAAFAYYAITEGTGVCGDYAQLFCILANHAGLESYECNSDNHAWSVVKIDGKFYHCDALWDQSEEEWIYFNKSPEYISSVIYHEYDTKRFPEFN